MKDYITLNQRAQDEFVERKSRFIGTATPVSTQEEAIAFIDEMRSKYWDATHNVYAYILRDGTKRYSDDGEPQGTAGVPVLDVLQKEGAHRSVRGGDPVFWRHSFGSWRPSARLLPWGQNRGRCCRNKTYECLQGL